LALLGAAPVCGALPKRLPREDDEFLEELSRLAFVYFIDQTHEQTGLVRDRSRTNGDVVHRVSGHDIASIAATGFGLTAMAIGVERRWIERAAAEQRVLTLLRFLDSDAPGQNGWFYHFVEFSSGERRWRSEVSSIDTALMMAGVLTVRQYFSENRDIVRLANKLYGAMDFQWMLNGNPYLISHGWVPETGFVPYRWDSYSEQTVLCLLAIGAPNNAISPNSWYAWDRPMRKWQKYTYASSVPPLFIHQFSHAWVDYRGLRENRAPGMDYFRNSVDATHAHRQFCMGLAKRFPKSYSADQWGITASDSPRGYRVWGGPPGHPEIDGTIVPCGPGGSLMFAPEICVPALRTMRQRFGERIWGRYGFPDAFNPTTGWVNADVIGIDVGITLLSAENLRTGNVWNWFMQSPEIQRAMEAVGLVRG
jgi:hypothetical protein